MKPERIVHLIGQQPMPILLAALQWPAHEHDLLATRETQPIAVRLATLLEAHGFHPRVIPIDKAPFETLLHELHRALKQSPSSNTWVHLTGGTKLMALTAAQVASHLNIPALYLDHDRHTFLLLSPDAQAQEFPMTIRIQLSDLLYAYGYRIARSYTRIPNEDLLPIAREIGQQAPSIWPSHKILPPDSRGRRRTVATLWDFYQLYQENPDTIPYALRQIFRTLDTIPTVDEYSIRKFLTGQWLEWYAYDTLRPLFDELQMAVHLHEKVKSIPNEIDLLGVAHNTLFVISCKSGRVGKEHLAELDVWRRQFGGSHAQGTLIFTYRAEARWPMIHRAEIYGIRIFTLEHLPHLQQEFKEWMVGSCPSYT